MYTIGLDLGQRQDFSAIAVVERRETRYGWQAPAFHSAAVRRLERAPLGTPYPKVVDRVRAMAQHPELRGRCAVAVDATGVGAPVVDMLRAAGLGCEIVAVTITGGEQAHASAGGLGVSRWSVPKRDLIAGLDVLLERGELRIARKTAGTGQLVKELLDVRMTKKSRGRVRMGADGCGEHDDLVIAVALGCWQATRGRSGWGGVRLMGI